MNFLNKWSFVIVVVLGFLWYLYDGTFSESSVVREITFADDSNTIHYKVGMTETVFSQQFDELNYYKLKSTYFLRFSPDRKDTYQENCYICKYNKRIIWLISSDYQKFECF
jgi:hypothetical protein